MLYGAARLGGEINVSKRVTNFYHGTQVLSEENREKRVFLLWMTDHVRRQLERTLAVLGIAVPEYM